MAQPWYQNVAIIEEPLSREYPEQTAVTIGGACWKGGVGPSFRGRSESPMWCQRVIGAPWDIL
ncbi:hypothetical protein CHELA20_11688 [Hyphomicrobiales bacterium]|nr:hypothetical protein CHELA20_11688 [Hyphomicrobiales bacterium]CAH1689593.1 hypothetical protein CHELA41_50142 [Hyphomicrobiales bacterium]